MFRKYRYFEGLTNLQFSTQGFHINYLGQVKDKWGNDIPKEKDEEGHWVVEVDSWNGLGKYRIIDLMTFQFKYIQIPKDLFGNIVAFVIDGNKDNVQANNIGYRFKGGKLEVPQYPGFYYIPSYTGYAVNKELELKNIKSGKKINWYVSKPVEEKNIKGGYRMADGKTSNGKFSRFTRHRVVGLVFMEYPDNCDTLVVNHLDGIPGNDYPENLEWTTRSGNNLHAYQNDLKNQHMRVLVRDVLTGEVVEYYSISEAARQMGLSCDESLRQRIVKSEFCKVFSDGKQVKLKSDERDWIIPSDPIQAMKDGEISRGVKARRCSDLLEFTFPSRNQAGRELPILTETIAWRLRHDNRNPVNGYQLANIDDPRPWPDFDKKQAEYNTEDCKRAVTTRNLYTGEIKEYPSLTALGKEHQASYFKKKMDAGNPAVTSNGIQFKYSDQPWIEIPNIEEFLYTNQPGILAREITTGKIYIADGAKELSNVLGIDYTSLLIAARARGNKIFKGYQIRRGFDLTEEWPVVE